LPRYKRTCEVLRFNCHAMNITINEANLQFAVYNMQQEKLLLSWHRLI